MIARRLWVLAALVATATPAFSQQSDAEWMAWQPDPATLPMPDITFAETEDTAKDYDKYFVFHRGDVTFEEAFADIRECDARARGLWDAEQARAQGGGGVSPYGIVGDAMQAAIFGPAQDRLARRASLRRCMFYKGYARYGIAKDAWETFNFHRAERGLSEAEIQQMLAQQALVASGPRPQGTELGL